MTSKMIVGDLRQAFTFIEPGPVTLVAANDGRKDYLMVISWTMAMDYMPHCHIAISTGPWNETYTVMMKTKECVISIPTAAMAKDVVEMGVESSSETDKFKKHKLRRKKGSIVKAPLIDNCIASLECKVVDTIDAYGLVILQCEKLWVNPELNTAPSLHANGDGTFRVDSDTILDYHRIMQQWVPEGSQRFYKD
jgi:flavin reductase (DIM6/NTAB) family NADH-FMN oxidoreductase RutF